MKWTVCTPANVLDFTAAGFYFGRELNEHLHVPIGLLHASWGGTSAESWTSLAALDTVPDFAARANEQIENLKRLPEQTRNFGPALSAWEQKYGRIDPGDGGWTDGDAGFTPLAFKTPWAKAGMPDGGIAWVRCVFDVPAGHANQPAHIDFGNVEEQYVTAYFNGRKIADSGRQPPQFYTRYFSVNLPAADVHAGKNVLALRVTADAGHKAILTRDGRSMGFDKLGVTDVTDAWSCRVERHFPPLTKAALAERPAPPKGDAAHTSSSLYGGMIHPLVPFAVKGFLWYQGEQDGSRGYAYRKLLPLMINDWRRQFGHDLPFIIQQLPNWKAGNAEQTGWAELREAQWLTAQALPNTYVSCAIDVGESDDVHPKDKRDVGRRLALTALANVYGRKVEYTGPRYESLAVEGDAMRIRFTHAEGLKTSDGQPPARFTIAGADENFVPADAKIDGQTVILSSPKLSHPVAARYAFVNDPVGCNLTNATGLPALPFRTDAWPGQTAKNK